MNEPTVTIIVPTYRRLLFLREALTGVLRQTYRDFELIVSDDGASDEIADYVASLKDPRIRYRRNERNLGIALNNLAAFREARGKYIASLHDDDIWEPDFLAVLVPLLEADPEVTVAFCDHYIIDALGNLLSDKTDFNTRFFRRNSLNPGRHQPFYRAALVHQSIPMVMAAVFRRSILDGAEYPPHMGGSYDYWLAYLAARGGKACHYVSRRLTRYRFHAGSGTAARQVRNIREQAYVRRRFLALPELAPYEGEMRNNLGVLYGKLALYYFERRSYRRGRVVLKKAFSLLNSGKNMAALAINVGRVLCRPAS